MGSSSKLLQEAWAKIPSYQRKSAIWRQLQEEKEKVTHYHW
jgi:hypothetical protein